MQMGVWAASLSTWHLWGAIGSQSCSGGGWRGDPVVLGHPVSASAWPSPWGNTIPGADAGRDDPESPLRVPITGRGCVDPLDARRWRLLCHTVLGGPRGREPTVRVWYDQAILVAGGGGAVEPAPRGQGPGQRRLWWLDTEHRGLRSPWALASVTDVCAGGRGPGLCRRVMLPAPQTAMDSHRLGLGL